MALTRLGNRDPVPVAAAFMAKYDVFTGTTPPLVHCEEWIPDEVNRDGKYASPEDILNNVLAVMGAGHHDSKTKAVLVELLDGVKEKQISWNEKKIASNECLPKIDKTRVKYTGIGGNTYNLGCRSINQRLPCTNAMVSDGDRFSMEKLRARSESYARNIEHGYHPKYILAGKIRSEEPDALWIIQYAENLEGACQRLEDEVQAILKLSKEVAMHPGHSVQSIIQVLTRHNPGLDEHASGYAEWTLSMGGAATNHIGWLALLHERHVGGAKRKVPGSKYSAVAQIGFDKPRVKRGVIWNEYCCPGKDVRNGICDYVKETEILAATKNKEWNALADQAEVFLEEIEASTRMDSDLDVMKQDHLVARSELHVVRVLFKRSKSILTLEDVRNVLREEKDELLKGPRIAAEKKSKSDNMPRLIKFGQDGKAADMEAKLAQKGVRVGLYVKKLEKREESAQTEESKKRKEPAQTEESSKEATQTFIYGVIDNISESQISIFLHGVAEAKHEKVSIEDFEKTWKPVMNAEEVKERGVVLDWEAHWPLTDYQILENVAKNNLVKALATCAKQAGLPKDLELRTKPRNGVRVLAEFAIEKLLLVPFTTNLAIGDEKGDCEVKDCVRTSHTCQHKDGSDRVIYLTPLIKLPVSMGPSKKRGQIVPFWFVRRTNKEDEANASLQVISLKEATVVNSLVFRFATSAEWKIPLLVNTKPLKDGDEVVLFDDSIKEKKRKEAMVYKAKPAAKVQKTD